MQRKTLGKTEKTILGFLQHHSGLQFPTSRIANLLGLTPVRARSALNRLYQRSRVLNAGQQAVGRGHEQIWCAAPVEDPADRVP